MCLECKCLFVCSPNTAGSLESLDDQTETESVVSFRKERPRPKESLEKHGEMRKHMLGFHVLYFYRQRFLYRTNQTLTQAFLHFYIFKQT